jgi:hypothetical protein
MGGWIFINCSFFIHYSALIIIGVRLASEIKTDYRPDASTRTSLLFSTTT